jgi:hypothetical protein
MRDADSADFATAPVWVVLAARVRRQRGEKGRAGTRPCLPSCDLYFNLLIELNHLCASTELHLSNLAIVGLNF